MRPKSGARGKVWYYLDKGPQPDGTRPWIPLGSDFPDALRKYAELVQTVRGPSVTVAELLDRWHTETAAGRKSGTLIDITTSLPHLKTFFDGAPLEQLQPVHISQYLAWRAKEAVAKKLADNVERIDAGKGPLAVTGNEGRARANREISWLSAAWNWARSNGATSEQNPTEGVKRHREPGRSMYIEDEEMAAILEHADEPLREAIELAYLIGQRPGDLRGINETDIRNGAIEIEQDKTGARLRIEIVGDLAALIDRIKFRKASIPGVRSLSLICNERGEAMGQSAMRYRFEKAREAAAAAAASNKPAADRLRSIQFRDLRAKAGSDSAGLEHAQKLLGHTKRDMTEHYIRKRRGDKVRPVK